MITDPMSETSTLGPIDPASIPEEKEEEKAAPWIIRKLVGSMTGRLVVSSYETLRAAGMNVVCLSAWGDSSPLFLPCIRFRDLAVHTVVAATGGIAAVATPVMGPVADVVITTFGDSILVELGMHTGFELTTNAANDLIASKTSNVIVPIHSKRLETTGVKVLLITLKHQQTMSDAALGFYRSSMHKDTSLFSAVKDYLAVEKGWFSPYLFASGRRPIIPRSMKPDIVFCHGPFLAGDYRIGETWLSESASVITLCDVHQSPPLNDKGLNNTSTLGADLQNKGALSFPSLSNIFSRSRTPSPEPALTPLPAPPTPRRMVILVLGLKPHRKLWTLSARPSESVINYVLLNGCPSIVVPVKVGAPLLAWDTLTIEQLWNIDIPAEDGGKTASGKFEGVISVVFEYLDLCVDWERVKSRPGDILLSESDEDDLTNSKLAVKNAVTLLVAAAIRSSDSKEAKQELDAERSGIAMWRIP